MESKRDREMESPDIMGNMSEDIEETMKGERPKRRFRGNGGMDPQKKSLILGAAGAILLIILLFVFFGGDKTAGKELDAVKSRLDAMEKRLVKAEAVEQKISPLESQIKGLQGSVNRLEGQARAMKEQADKLAQAQAQAQAAASKPQPQAPSPKPQAQASVTKKPAQAEKQHLHEVRRGETLFSIAKKYGMTPDELRRQNHMSKNDSIQLGQKLIVGPSN